MFLGVIADDFMGTSDIAGFLADNGLLSAQCNGVSVFSFPESAQAIGASLSSRSSPAEEVAAPSLDALRHCKRLDCLLPLFQILLHRLLPTNYCL